MRVYLVTNGTHYKIGIAKDVARRIKQLQTGCATPIYLVATSPPMSKPVAQYIERQIHRGLDYRRLNGEWFSLNDRQIHVVLSEMRYFSSGAGTPN